jgi:hypothetical protein
MNIAATKLNPPSFLNGVFRLGTSAATMCAVGVTGELYHIRFLQPEDLLESATNVLQDIFPLSCRATFVGLIARNVLSNGTGPQTNTVKALSDIHHNAHHFVVIVVLKGLSNGSKLRMQPEIVDRNGTLVFERIRPFATVLILLVFPLWSNSFLEQVVIGF